MSSEISSFHVFSLCFLSSWMARESVLPLVHAVCGDRSNWNTSALLPAETHGVPHHTNCSSEPSSHLGIWKFSLEILLSHFPIVPLERQMTHRSGKTQLISVADTATMQMGRYCELHAVPPSTKPQLPYNDNQNGTNALRHPQASSW